MSYLIEKRINLIMTVGSIFYLKFLNLVISNYNIFWTVTIDLCLNTEL